MKVVGIIPARLASTRFPGKPLVKIHGKPMIEHVYRRVQCANLIDELYIATCDEEIAVETERFGGKAIMTSSAHTRCTDRAAEAAKKINADIVINIQGDEPLIDPDALDESISIMKNNNSQCLNWITPISKWEVFISRDTVKAVVDKDNKILYFSRQPIPNCGREDFKNAFKQMGVYVFRKQFLLQYASWREMPLEKAEKVDMLRILEHGFAIDAFITKDMIGVDTPQDLSLVEQALLEEPLYNRIFKTGCK